MTIGFSPLLGSHNHIAAGLLMKAAGGERFGKELDQDYAPMKAVLVDLGLAR